jgi:hypothetical protein
MEKTYKYANPNHADGLYRLQMLPSSNGGLLRSLPFYLCIKYLKWDGFVLCEELNETLSFAKGL